jgi:hypothetical protein
MTRGKPIMLIIKIHNDSTGTNESANYNYNGYINKRCIFSGRIEGHDRKQGWIKLLHRLVIIEREKEWHD